MKSVFNTTPPVETAPSLTVELGRTAALSAASVAGLLVGAIVVGSVSRKLSARKARKNAAQTAPIE